MRYLITSPEPLAEFLDVDPLTVRLERERDRAVCLAMMDRDRSMLETGSRERRTAADLRTWPTTCPDPDRILAWVRRQSPASVTADTIPPMLTSSWDETVAGLHSRFGNNAEVLLDILRAADSRHTWQDCAEAAASIPDTEPDLWPRFWSRCVELRLAEDVGTEGLVRSPRRKGLTGWPPRPGTGTTTSGCGTRRRRSSPAPRAGPGWPPPPAAVAVGDLAGASRLCTELSVLCRRYAEDAAGLLDDLALVADAMEDQTFGSTGGGELRPLAPDVRTLRSSSTLSAKHAVPPAEFAPVLRDRLVEHNALQVVAGPADRVGARAPVQLRRVTDEQDLRTSTYAATAPVRSWPWRTCRGGQDRTTRPWSAHRACSSSPARRSAIGCPGSSA